ncbi:MAG: tetratricopeptide repeat protein, partial [Planctomycetota bacterium]
VLVIAFAKDGATGRGDASIRVTQPIHLTLDSPRLLREGDKASARVVLVGQGDKGYGGDLSFTVHQGGKDSTYVEKMSFGGTVEMTFEIDATTPGPGWVQITFDRQSVRKPLTIEAWGTPRALTQSASATGRTTITVDVPAAKDAVAPSLDILVARGDVELLRFLDEADPADDGVAAEVARLAARVDARSLLTHPKNAVKSGWAVDAEVKDLARRLMLLQNPDGGWPWQRTPQTVGVMPQQMANQPAGQRRQGQQSDQEYVNVRRLPSDPFVTGLAFHVLTRVEKAGDKDLAPVLDGAAQWLMRTFRDTEDNDLKALCLAALSARNDSQIFAYANRLYRGKETLGPRALVLTAIAFQQIGKVAEGREMLALFAAKGVVKDGHAYWEMPADELGGLQSAVELTALGVEAMALLTPDDARIQQGWTWLLAQRTGHGWRTANETLICADVATILASQRADFTTPETVTVTVNGKAVATVGAPDSVAWGRVRIPAASLHEGANEVVLEPKGAGAFTYAARLSYASPGYAGVETPTFEKRYRFPAMRDDGEELPIGYNVVRGSFKPLENPLDAIAAQEPFTVTLQVVVKDRTTRYLVVEDPIPAGCSVVDGSVQGEYASFSVERGRVVFRLQHEGDEGVYDLSYRLYPLHAGAYRLPPTSIGAPTTAEPSRVGVREKPFTVLAAGTNYRETYVRTPDELYGLGGRLQGRKEHDKALTPLEELLAKWKLDDAVYTDVSRMLVQIYLEKKDSANVVRFFEVLKEKDPSAVVPFDDIVKIGGAYRDMKEWERAMQVFRGTLDSYFLQEANVSGSLEAVGKARSSVEFMKKLALSYPDTEEIRRTVYSLGGDLFRRAKGMSEGPKPADAEQYSRSELLAESIAMLRGSLRENPKAKDVDAVVFTLGNAYLEQQAYETAEAWSRLSYERFKESRFHSSFEYMVAYALFALKKYDEALAMCDTIIASSNPGPSEYIPQARHMMGQIFHAMGDVEKALASYREVKASFPDAARAIDYLERQALGLPEVTTVPLKDRHEVELESRGVGEVTMKAYKVDLMMLYLKQRSLNDVTKVNLAGVKPVWEKKVKLENGSHFKKVLTKIGIDVKGPGAFLIIARSGDISASGMLISSDLTLDVQVDPNQGVVRTNVIGRTDGKFVENAKVSGIGSRDSGFSQSRTDLRGVAELEGLRGFPTVIVEKEGHYGFFRGASDLAMAEAAAQQEQYQMRGQTKQQQGNKAALQELEKNLK